MTQPKKNTATFIAQLWSMKRDYEDESTLEFKVSALALDKVMIIPAQRELKVSIEW